MAKLSQFRVLAIRELDAAPELGPGFRMPAKRARDVQLTQRQRQIVLRRRRVEMPRFERRNGDAFGRARLCDGSGAR